MPILDTTATGGTASSVSACAQLGRRDWTNRPPSVLLLHGVTSSSGTWWQIGPRLAAAGFVVTALDLPGHGVTGPAGGPLEPPLAAAAVAAALREPVDLLIGHSLGALVALRLLAEHPQLARRLVLEDPPGPDSEDWVTEADDIERSTPEVRRDPQAAIEQTRTGQPRWQPQDVRQSVLDVIACDERAVAAARAGPWPSWPPVSRRRC
jgi:pimeloyl-ACP methyl ester carboxylesterase